MTYQEATANKSKIFTSAWQIAKKGATKFGGKAREYFAQSLAFVYSEIRRLCKPAAKVVEITVAEMVRAAYEMKSALTAWERDFITDNVKRVDRFGEKTGFSDKQAEIIRRIYGKVESIA